MFTTDTSPQNKWYALEPKTYKVLGWSRKLKTLRKRFNLKEDIIYSKIRPIPIIN